MPGVHARAVDGVRAIASIAAPATHSNTVSGCLADSRLTNLNPDPLPPPPDRFAEVVHLGADNVVDRLARTVHVLAHGLGDLIHRYRVEDLFAAVARGSISTRRTVASPPRALAPPVRRPTRAGPGTVARPPGAFESGQGGPLCSLSRRAQNR